MPSTLPQASMVMVVLWQLLFAHAFSQWAHDPAINTPVCTATGQQRRPAIASDCAGGAIIAWNDYRNGSFSDVYAQRVNASGVAQWGSNGVAICIAGSPPPISPIPPAIVSDGVGGAIIVWHDFRTGSWTIYAQRINSAGDVLWGVNGRAVSPENPAAPVVQLSPPSTCADGSEGAIVAWETQRNGGTSIYAQRINGAGSMLWDSSGIALAPTSNDWIIPRIASDGKCGAYVIWNQVFGSGYALYVQSVDSSGTVKSGPDATRIWAIGGVSPAIISDGTGGAVIAWQNDARTSLNAQHFYYPGGAHWPEWGVPISTTALAYSMTQGPAGGVVFAWSDSRNESNLDIYAQSINASGTALWDSSGIAVGAATYNEVISSMFSDAGGNVIITWRDDSNKLYAQKINSSGAVQWRANGVLLCASVGSSVSDVTGDNAGGVIVSWEDYRNAFESDIYVQQLNADGDLGIVLTGVNESDHRPLVFRLHQNYPNPFNPSTTITFDLPSKIFVVLKVFTLLGKDIATIVSSELPAGYHSKQWNASGMPSGVYFCRLQTGTFSMTNKMVLLR
jgi:hypothetical protein